MEQEVNTNGTAPFLLIQKPQELIRLFERMIDRKIREITSLNLQPVQTILQGDSPFLTSKEVQQIFNVSRQTINDWRKSDILHSLKIKSRRFFFKEEVEHLKKKWNQSNPQV